MRTCGFSASKIATIKAIAEAALTGVVRTREVAATMDDETLISQMVAINGVGRWTVETFLMYSLERMDVLPSDDFGVRESYRSLKSLPEQPKPKLRSCVESPRRGLHTAPSPPGISGAYRANAATS